MIQENYPGIRVTIMDTTLATLMQGLMIQEIVRFQRSGADYDALIKRADEIKDTCRIFFTVENMDYLVHGGRVGKLAGISANILNLRPMILMTQGELFPSGLARGPCSDPAKRPWRSYLLTSKKTAMIRTVISIWSVTATTSKKAKISAKM